MQFTGYRGGRPVIRIQADRLTLEKKKVGLFRIGLLHEARLQNAWIRYDVGGTPPEGAGIVTTQEILEERIGCLQGLLKEASFPQFRGKRITSFVIEPVRIELHEGESVLSGISADKAVVDMKTDSILFEGNVLVEAGRRRIRAGTARLRPKAGALRIDGPYELNLPGDYHRGENLTTDILLKDFEPFS